MEFIVLEEVRIQMGDKQILDRQMDNRQEWIREMSGWMDARWMVGMHGQMDRLNEYMDWIDVLGGWLYFTDIYIGYMNEG